jgi:DNA-binding PadR family transcriptional regulator
MSLKHTILGLLHYKEMHGYRIKEHIERNFGYMWSVNYGQIYPALKKLQNEGLIAMKEVVQNGEKGPPRKLYSLEQAGRDEFKRWLESFPEKQMLIRDPFLMRLVFFGFGTKKRALELIEDQIRQYKKQLENRRENAKRWEKSDVYVKLVADLGVTMNNVILEWLETSQKEIALHAGGDD